MKKILALAVLLTTFVSCGKKDGGGTVPRSAKDSLETVIRVKDSLINEAFININDIASTLNQIAEREKLITKQTAGELNKTTRVQISENLEAINQLLLQNRARIAGLQASSDKLKKANVQIDGLQKLVASLQEQQSAKDLQIESLTKQVKALNIKVSDLQVTVQNLRDEKSGLQHEVAIQSEEINTVYYIVGAEKSLISKEIIDKKGFIGRTRVIGDNADLSDFTQADKRLLERVEVGGKKTRVVSSHPENSYMLVMSDKNTVDELVITNKDEFWKNSNILIISHK